MTKIVPAKQPCRTCDYFNGGNCKVGGEVKAWWTGCAVWRPIAEIKIHDEDAQRKDTEHAANYNRRIQSESAKINGKCVA